MLFRSAGALQISGGRREDPEEKKKHITRWREENRRMVKEVYNKIQQKEQCLTLHCDNGRAVNSILKLQSVGDYTSVHATLTVPNVINCEN